MINTNITLPTLYSGVIPDKATQTKEEFANNVYPFMVWWNDNNVPQLQTLGTDINSVTSEINTTATEMNTLKTTTETARDEAVVAKNIAVNSANYKGDWVSGTSYALGDSVSHSSLRYLSKADNNTDEPPTNNWENLNMSLEEDSNPKLGGDLDCVTYSVNNLKLGTDLICNSRAFQQSSYKQLTDISTSGSVSLDYSLGDYLKLTATGDITLSFDNFVTGKVCNFILECVNFGLYTITFPTGTNFAKKTAPSFTESGKDVLLIQKDKNDIFSIFLMGNNMGGV